MSPESTLDDVLREMRETQIHFALVGQSDSQFIGLITLEDVLEAIVGEIVDESDKVHRKTRSRILSAYCVVPAIDMNHASCRHWKPFERSATQARATGSSL